MALDAEIRAPVPSPVAEALDALTRGDAVVVADDRGEHGAALVLAAQFASPAAIAFMTRAAGGRVGLALTRERCDALGLRPLGRRTLTPTIDARSGVGSGASARDQARTMRVAIDPDSGAHDIVVGGHVQPIVACDGGVLECADHANAAVDLARVAGLAPAGVTCPIQNEDGSPAADGELAAFCARHGLKLLHVGDVIALRWRHLKLVSREVETRLPTLFGEFTAIGYRSRVGGGHHLALVAGDIAGATPPLVRLHTECLAGNVLHSLECDCRAALDRALELIAADGVGVVVYITHDRRTDALRTLGDDHPAEEPPGFAWGVGAQILEDLGVDAVRVLTKGAETAAALRGLGLRVAAEIPLA